MCIPNINDSRYKALKRALVCSGDALARIEIKRIIDITKRFVTALGSERRIRYCGNEDCKTLPFMKVDSKGNELLTRSFIPTAYHILQDYDLLYLKSEILLKDLESFRELKMGSWRRTILNRIDQTGLNKNAQYYQDCIDTINQVISLRNYDMEVCIENPNNDIKEKHKDFLDVLKKLRKRIQILKSKRHPSQSPRGTPPPRETSPQGTNIINELIAAEFKKLEEGENTGKSVKNPKPKLSETEIPAPTGFRLLKKDNEEDFFGVKNNKNK